MKFEHMLLGGRNSLAHIEFTLVVTLWNGAQLWSTYGTLVEKMCDLCQAIKEQICIKYFLKMLSISWPPWVLFVSFRYCFQASILLKLNDIYFAYVSRATCGVCVNCPAMCLMFSHLQQHVYCGWDD